MPCRRLSSSFRAGLFVAWYTRSLGQFGKQLVDRIRHNPAPFCLTPRLWSTAIPFNPLEGFPSVEKNTLGTNCTHPASKEEELPLSDRTTSLSRPRPGRHRRGGPAPRRTERPFMDVAVTGLWYLGRSSCFSPSSLASAD